MNVKTITDQIRNEMINEMLVDYWKRYLKTYSVTFVSDGTTQRHSVNALNAESALRQGRALAQGASVTVVDLGKVA